MAKTAALLRSSAALAASGRLPFAVENLHEDGHSACPRLHLVDPKLELVKRPAGGHQHGHAARGEVGEPLRRQAHRGR